MEKYVWEGSASHRSIQSLLKRLPGENQVDPSVIQQFSQAVTRIHNEGKSHTYSIALIDS